jgi:catechol-2,3-dioxygenase
MIKPVALVNGHYECRSLEQTVPILQELLALEVVSQGNGGATMKHPNTDWLLALHESPGAPDKPHYHHCGVRVATDQEVDNAYEYLQKRKVVEAHRWLSENCANHGNPEPGPIGEESGRASFLFTDPDGNYWEIIAPAN